MSYADIVLATVPAAPPTWKNRRATSWPAPISANVPYFFASRFIWNAFLSVPRSISAFTFPRCGTLARLSSRAAQTLHPHALGAACRDPAALIVRQRGVNPIAAVAQNLDLAPGRQNQNALRGVGRGQVRFDFFSGNHGQDVAMRPIFQRKDRKDADAADQNTERDEPDPAGRPPTREKQMRGHEQREPERDGGGDRVLLHRRDAGVVLDPIAPHLQRARLIPRQSQIRFRFRMARVERECPLIIEDRLSEIAEPIPGVAYIIK